MTARKKGRTPGAHPLFLKWPVWLLNHRDSWHQKPTFASPPTEFFLRVGELMGASRGGRLGRWPAARRHLRSG